MSTSRKKQIAQRRKTKTKNNGTKLSYAKRKGMRKGPKHLTGATKKRR